MALVSLPPELRSICRRLASANVEQLPPLLPVLLGDVGRCRDPLSRPLDPKISESSPEAAVLVHRLKTQITTLLTGRTTHGHFVGTALVKAVIENGGWECLRTSKPWVHGLISIIQKKDLAVTKNLCVVTITKIYMLMREYPTLVREIVTPTLPDFARACLQVLKPPISSKVGKAPYSLVETIFEAISTLIPLHPTTFREFASKFRSEVRTFLVPTISDNVLVPNTLRISSRRLAVRLHMTAAKGGDSTEWTKHVEELVKTCHDTADQVFRAVRESWESAIGHKPLPINVDIEPRGAGGDLDQYPGWVGIQAGGERMIGLLAFIEEYLRCHTRVAVTIPITALMDIALRISSIRPPIGKDKHDSGMNPAIGREERDELWAVFPDIQIASMKLQITLKRRLESNYIPLAQESLEQTLRILQSIYRLPRARTVAFTLVRGILQLCGPTLPKFTVESLGLLTKCCCRDLLGAAGYLPGPKAQSSSSAAANGQKANKADADVYLPGRSQGDSIPVLLDAEHLGAASALLTTLFAHLPQQHIPSSLRSQMLRAAVLGRHRDAQVASILHPARDRSGRVAHAILPYLEQQFPRDEGVELLRFNFRPAAFAPPGYFADADADGDYDMTVDDEGQEGRDETRTAPSSSFGRGFGDNNDNNNTWFQSTAATSDPPPEPTIPARSSENEEQEQEEPAVATPFLTHLSAIADPLLSPAPATSSSLKRKNEDAAAEISISKRIEIDIEATATTTTATATTTTTTKSVAIPSDNAMGEGEESSDDESVHLNMELDTDSDDEEEEGENGE